eukprot:NODE_362_length_8790_cov_0.566678.p8 type:complete len:171 gc:universal NODE_362_length_8790_cov_0.566678:1360-848(-)
MILKQAHYRQSIGLMYFELLFKSLPSPFHMIYLLLLSIMASDSKPIKCGIINDKRTLRCKTGFACSKNECVKASTPLREPDCIREFSAQGSCLKFLCDNSGNSKTKPNVQNNTTVNYSMVVDLAIVKLMTAQANHPILLELDKLKNHYLMNKRVQLLNIVTTQVQPQALQ